MGEIWLHVSAAVGSIVPAATGTASENDTHHRAHLAADVAVMVGASVSLAAVPMNAEEVERPQPAPTWQSSGHESQYADTEVEYLEITAIKMRQTLRSEVTISAMSEGPARWKGTSLPGGPGNTVIAGHRTTNTRPFCYLKRREPGDAINIIDGKSSSVIYLVSETMIIQPEYIWITYETGEPIVLHFAGHFRGSARERIVTRGDLPEIVGLL